MDKDDVILSQPITTHTQLYYNLTWVVSKGLERRECSSEHSSLGLFFSYKLNSCMFMYISSELHKFSLYKYKHIARHFSRVFNIQKEFHLSPNNSILSHVNIQRSIHRSSSTTTKQTSNIFHLLYLRYHYKFVLIISPSWDII